MPTKICKRCGEPFLAKKNNILYCDKCLDYMSTRRGTKRPRCQKCGEPFFPPVNYKAGTLCGVCRQEERTKAAQTRGNKRKEKVCMRCGKIYIAPTGAGSGTNKYCQDCGEYVMAHRYESCLLTVTCEACGVKYATDADTPRTVCAACRAKETGRKCKSLAEVSREARAHGMTYGQYMAAVKEGRV